jgi:MSHA biogenesis protein MshN
MLPEEGTIAKTPEQMPAVTAGSEPNEPAPVNPSLDTMSPAPVTDRPADAVSSSSRESADYLVLRNTRLPPETRSPKKVNKGIPSKSPSVKTANPVAPRPLDEVRQEIELGELSYAEYLLHEHLGAAPGDGEARELLIGLMLRGERNNTAMVQLERGLEHEPGNAKLILIKARLLAQSADVQGALQVLEATSTEGAGEVQRLQMLGALYQQLARYEQAEASYRALLELTPASAAAWAGLGLSLDGLGAPAAYEAYRQALELGYLPAAADAYVRQRVAELETARD